MNVQNARQSLAPFLISRAHATLSAPQCISEATSEAINRPVLLSRLSHIIPLLHEHIGKLKDARRVFLSRSRAIDINETRALIEGIHEQNRDLLGRVSHLDLMLYELDAGNPKNALNERLITMRETRDALATQISCSRIANEIIGRYETRAINAKDTARKLSHNIQSLIRFKVACERALLIVTASP